jgi:hypothetical protein
VYFTIYRLSICALLVTAYTTSWYSSCTHIFYSKGNFHFTNRLPHRTVYRVHKRMAWRVDPLQIPPNSISALVSYIDFIKPHDTLRLLQICYCFLDSSATGYKSLQLHMHALIQNSDNCNLISEGSAIFSCLIVSQQISEILQFNCAHSV